jgi:protein-tyrosine phosphatase
MIDLHAHILPGLDDGPENLEEALEMAAVYVAAGFSRAVATPHWVAGSVWQPTPEKVLKWVAGFRRALAKREIGLEVVPGMEIALTIEISELIRAGQVLTLNGGRYVLVELPFQQLPVGWDQILFEISAMGYRVLLAHPERCSHLTREPEVIREMVDMEVGIQVNWKSLLGQYGKTVCETAWSFLEGGLAHCLATDGHRPGDINAEKLRRMKRDLSERLGDERARLLVEENPGRVWAGEPLERLSPVGASSRKKTRRRWLKWH